MERTRRRRLARELADDHDGVASRAELSAVGISRHDVRSEVDGGRWLPHGRQTIAVHTGPLTTVARCWVALFETGTAITAIDGATALQHAGLKGYDDDDLHVSVVHNHNTERLEGVRIHKVIRRVTGELIDSGLTRTRPEVAAIRAAHWARSDRQAALVLLMTVQQRLTTPMRLAAAQRLVRGRTRRSFIRAVVRDIAFGVQSLGELDFARLCRARGLPEPSRQVVRQTPAGRIYLDVGWDDVDLVVEIDGAQHRWGLAVTKDNLRQNDITLSGDRVLRIDIIGLRLATDRFMDQVALGLARRNAA